VFSSRMLHCVELSTDRFAAFVLVQTRAWSPARVVDSLDLERLVRAAV
jgi:hypothetical protein